MAVPSTLFWGQPRPPSSPDARLWVDCELFPQIEFSFRCFFFPWHFPHWILLSASFSSLQSFAASWPRGPTLTQHCGKSLFLLWLMPWSSIIPAALSERRVRLLVILYFKKSSTLLDITNTSVYSVCQNFKDILVDEAKFCHLPWVHCGHLACFKTSCYKFT